MKTMDTTSSIKISGIDVIGEDLLENLLSRLPALSFASAACVSRSWNLLCDSILSTPKLSSALSQNPSLQDAVEEVFHKVFAEPIRPHFAIASVGPSFCLHKARQLITEKLGSTVPVIFTAPYGLIGRDAITNEFREVQWEVTEDHDPVLHFLDEDPVAVHFDEDPGTQSGNQNRAILLTVGFLPGLKVAAIPLFQSKKEVLFVEEFVTHIRECTASVSGCASPTTIMLFADIKTETDHLLEKLDYAMSPETVIVGDGKGVFLYGGDCMKKNARMKSQHPVAAAVALIFMRDKDKPHGIGNIQFHAALSSGISPIGPTYKAVSVKESHDEGSTWLTARRDGFVENLDGQTILNHIYDEINWYSYRFGLICPKYWTTDGWYRPGSCLQSQNLNTAVSCLEAYDVSLPAFGWTSYIDALLVFYYMGDRIHYPALYIGVVKRRKCSVGMDKVRWITSQVFHEIYGGGEEYLYVGGGGIKTGDFFHFFNSDSQMALSSLRNVSDKLRCLKEDCDVESSHRLGPASSGKKKVFGGIIFSCCGRGEPFFGKVNADSSPFLENFPGVTLAGSFCGGEIGRSDSSSYCREPQQEGLYRCCVHSYSSVYLVMSYTAPHPCHCCRS